MRLVICDGKKQNADSISMSITKYAENTNVIFNISQYSNAKDLLFNSDSYDVAIINVNLVLISGIELGKALKAINPNTFLIYISDDYDALDDAMSLGAIRYFVTPLEQNKIFNALDYIIKLMDSDMLSFHLNNQRKIRRINKSEIIYIEIQNRKTKIVTTKGTFYSRQSMKIWKEELLGPHFDTPHNSFIVNFDFIDEYNKNKNIILDDKYNISISRTKGFEFHKNYSKYLKNTNKFKTMV